MHKIPTQSNMPHGSGHVGFTPRVSAIGTDHHVAKTNKGNGWGQSIKTGYTEIEMVQVQILVVHNKTSSSMSDRNMTKLFLLTL